MNHKVYTWTFQEWYTSLSTFGFLPSESEEGLASDPNRRLMSLIVKKVGVGGEALLGLGEEEPER